MHGIHRAGVAVIVAALAMLALPVAVAADVVSDWNETMIEAQALANTPTPPGTRLAAIVQISVFDAVNGVSPRYTSVHVAPAAPSGASRAAAAAGAAHEALVVLFPAQKALFDARLALTLGTLRGSESSMAAGLAWGTSVADQIIAWRASDGWDTVLPPYVSGSDPGDWVPTPPAFVTTPLFRQVAVTTPFALTSAAQFALPGPPPLTSSAYADAFNEVKAMGSLSSTTRTSAQTLTAQFWASDSVVGFWNRVALQLLAHREHSLVREARSLALLNMSMADGAIAVWDAKNRFDTWRPITAIRQAGLDGNSTTDADSAWVPLIVTPPFQEYPSGHAGVSGSGAGMLAILFGRSTPFTITSINYPGTRRSYATFSDALDDIADARTFGGIHFRFASVDASHMGGQIAAYIVRTKMVRLPGHRR